MAKCDMKDCRHHNGRDSCSLKHTYVTVGGTCYDFQAKIRCDACESYRWDREYEYEYCAKDILHRRLPIYQPPWCQKLK